jgi:hypothetical protein
VREKNRRAEEERERLREGNRGIKSKTELKWQCLPKRLTSDIVVIIL